MFIVCGSYWHEKMLGLSLKEYYHDPMATFEPRFRPR